MKEPGLSFVTPVAYDFRYALKAVQAYYGAADEIVLGLDRERISWSGMKYNMDEGAFREGIRLLDSQAKVKVVEGDFHSRGSATLNDTDERNVLSLACRPGHWIVQIDSDEMVLNAGEFRAWLLGRTFNWNVLGNWLTVFKSFRDAYLVVDKTATISVATRSRGLYTGCRDTKQWKRRSPLKMLHFSWGRTEAEVGQKLKNWTHSGDFDTDRFLQFWRSVNLENYQSVRDFHPMDGPDWPSLRLVKRGDPDYLELGV